MKHILILITILSMQLLGDNKIMIDQVGDGLKFRAEQSGNDNLINFSIRGYGNNIDLLQKGNNNEIEWVDYWGSALTYGGDLDGNNNNIHFAQICDRGSNCTKSDIGFHIPGNSNNIRWGQGYYLTSTNTTTFAYDGDEGGGHTLNFDGHGDNNSLAGSQRNGSSNLWSGHTSTIYYYSDQNSFYVQQDSDGAKNLTLKTYNDGNTGSVVQSGEGTHSATINLSGSASTNINLAQQGNTAQSYALTQNCQTLGGCSISVTQQ